MMLNEHLNKVDHSMGFVCGDLKGARRYADPVTDLLLAQLRSQAVALQNAVAQLRHALGQKENKP